MLDSWVRYEGQVKQRQQRELAQSIIAKVQKELENPKTLQQILQQSVLDVESGCPALPRVEMPANEVQGLSLPRLNRWLSDRVAKRDSLCTSVDTHPCAIAPIQPPLVSRPDASDSSCCRTKICGCHESWVFDRGLGVEVKQFRG